VTWATVTRALLERTASSSGEEFYRSLARAVAEALACKFGFVGVQTGSGERIRIRAGWSDGSHLPPFEYELDGTPCAEVVERGACHIPRDVARLFPRDKMLAEMGIESYTGFRVTKRGGGVTGLIIGLHDAPTSPLGEEHSSALELFAQRVAVELERETIEQALRESEARYREIVTTCAEGVWTIDMQGRTTFVNPQLAEMLGYAPAEMIGRSFFDFMDAEGRRSAEVNLERRKRGIRESHEFRLKRRDGTDLWTIMATNPLRDAHGEIVGALAMVSDVTQRRGLEARIQQAQKLESVGLLAGGIAHDFNNLLVGILGNADLALSDLPEDSWARASIQDVRDAAWQLADLTKQLLAYSGRGRFVVEPLDLNRLVSETTHLINAAISKKATLRYHFAPDLPTVTGDATQIRQIVINLITNASDALEGREGQIVVTTGHVRADAEYLRSMYLDASMNEGDYAFFEVADTGSGMDAATMQKVFDPFFTTKLSGRGLGLAAVLGILRGHHGAIKIDSEVGEGTTIRVLLPVRADGTPRRDDVASAPAPQVARGLVLVADDVDIVRQVVVATLEDAGYQVIEARDGKEAVDLVDAHADELVAVLLDMSMPRLNGAEVFAHIQRVRPTLPVVLSSGYSEQDTMSKLVGEGLVAFLPKPWGAADLVAAISKARATRTSR